MRAVRRLFRRLTNRYPTLTCKLCGYRVPFFGNVWEQAGRAYDHWEANHDVAPAVLPTEKGSQDA